MVSVATNGEGYKINTVESRTKDIEHKVIFRIIEKINQARTLTWIFLFI